MCSSAEAKAARIREENSDSGSVDVDELEASRINLVDNRANDVADYDVEALVDQLQGLPDLEATGYDEAALTQLLSGLADDPEEGERDPDQTPETAPSRVDVGDIWQMGDHFLICGDAADAAVLDRLLGEEVAAMVWTQPPFNVDYEGKTVDALKIENDARRTPGSFSTRERPQPGRCGCRPGSSCRGR